MEASLKRLHTASATRLRGQSNHRRAPGQSLAALAAAVVFAAMLLPAAGRSAQRPALPLHTQGRWIVDARNRPIELASVSWYGADQNDFVPGGLDRARLADIARLIRSMGFNSVRLLWANETFERNPVVPDYAVRANPEFRGKHAMDVFDSVVAALAREHLMIVLDNHMSRADWCCSETDGNGLWHTKDYPESSWLADWRAIVRRYRAQPYVIGADLRNELRSGAAWGGNDPSLDWHAAAERGGDAVLAENPRLLIFVESIHYSTDFRQVGALPVHLAVANRVVYSPHDYGWDHPAHETEADLARQLDARWGYLIHMPDPAPVWVGEFGICHGDLDSCTFQGRPIGAWFPLFIRYLRDTGISWSYWALNGTQSTGASRTYGAEETYGMLDMNYAHPASDSMLRLLQSAMGPSGAQPAR